jgi:hypothetical protein
MSTDRKPGWDSKAIARISNEHYGGLAGLFAAHGWPERGSAMMTAQQRHIAEHYGSVERFEAAQHPRPDMTPEEMLDGRLTVMLTSFWGWTPESWGTVGFTSPTRRDTIVQMTTDPFVVFVYVTKSAPGAPRDIKGWIAGFYLVSHIAGDRTEFTDQSHHQREPAKWRHSLKALRAFSFLPEYRLHVDDFDPTISTRAQSVSQWAEEISADSIANLKGRPFVEVPVFGGRDGIDTRIHVPDSARGMVRGGPVNRSGYWVDGEPIDTEKELYGLALDGDTENFLGEPALGRRIYKIGLSISPKSRLQAFQSALPRGSYNWAIERSTRTDHEPPYPTFGAALAGEIAMKESLSRSSKWLGGEFYAATDEDFDAAWALGREHALAWKREDEK